MKRNVIVTLLLLLLPAAGLAFGPGAERGCGPGQRSGPAKWEDGEREERQVQRLGKWLRLDPEQQEKVAAILAMEAEKARPLRAQMRENRVTLQTAVHSGVADEKAIRELAAAQGKIEADLLILRARSWQQIYTLLTPEQQEMAKNPPARFRPGGERPGSERGNRD